MAAQDVALALRRLIDSPWACRSLAAGDEYALAGLSLTQEERDLLLRDVTDSLEDMTERLASACIDPTLRDSTGSGAFFAAAQHAMRGLEAERSDLEAFLTTLKRKG
jgi:hypothetical protein